MTDARAAFFEALEAAQPPKGPPPTRVPAPEMPDQPEAILGQGVEQAGGRLQHASRADWPGTIDWPMARDEIQHLYACSEAEPLVPSRGVGASRIGLRDLAALDVCVLHAEFAVVENGACWHVPASPFERAAALLAEHLLILVDRAALVPTLHQAYERIDLAKTRFGWFLCGPSKTADIEQALVLGAHGPRSMSLILLR